MLVNREDGLLVRYMLPEARKMIDDSFEMTQVVRKNRGEENYIKKKH